MQYRLYTDTTEATDLILYFNGWAMTPESVEHLERPVGYDLAILWDYREVAWPLGLDLTRYEHIHLVAWSMGVWAADILLHTTELPIARAVAVCGTGYPMSDAYGIPVAIFRGTLEGLTDANRVRFNRRMCGGRTYKHLFEALAARPTAEIYDELHHVLSVEAHSEQPIPKAKAVRWTLALVGGQDRIVPACSQETYWRGMGVEVRTYPEAAHYLMGTLSLWTQLW